MYFVVTCSSNGAVPQISFPSGHAPLLFNAIILATVGGPSLIVGRWNLSSNYILCNTVIIVFVPSIHAICLCLQAQRSGESTDSIKALYEIAVSHPVSVFLGLFP
jgi:hypothetical protein